ncbi:transglutaminase-like cysteine peptidase [Limoniibacter endophyticus]|nr:transglutaminase-like cysteine peptidase [Limoniibacter endophyticus]
MIGSIAKKIALMTFALGGFSQPAMANGASMTVGARTSQPIGHYEFCQVLPDECAATTPVRSIELTRPLWELLKKVNLDVNSSYVPMTDMEMWGVEERWSYPEIGADCEDYALEKRRRLTAAGIPASNLLMTVALQPDGSGHAVLTLTTRQGDFILDNIEPKILAWHDTSYTYLKRQSAAHAGVWLAINDGRDVPVASLR